MRMFCLNVGYLLCSTVLLALFCAVVYLGYVTYRTGPRGLGHALGQVALGYQQSRHACQSKEKPWAPPQE